MSSIQSSILPSTFSGLLIIGQAGNAVKDLKKSISVNVGGIKCQVGSQYVSNQDFLEVQLSKDLPPNIPPAHPPPNCVSSVTFDPNVI